MVITPRELGERIELARDAAGKRQEELASAVGIDRTAISKIKSGTRKVSALELAALASFLDRPLAWFLSESPEPVVARRQASVVDQPSTLTAELVAEDLASAVDQLRALDMLEAGRAAGRAGSFGRIQGRDGAAEAARRARRAAGLGNDPLGPMTDVLDAFGLYVTTVVVGESVDGLMLPRDGYGVVIINAHQQPGRRRFTAAHELGHFLFDDAYSAETISMSNVSEREQLVNAFAAEFLLPLEAVRSYWRQHAVRSSGLQMIREAAVWLSSNYRISWSGVLVRLAEAGYVDEAQARDLAPTPTRHELRAYGRQPEVDLDAGDLSAAVSRAVLRAFREGLIGRSRALEILRSDGDDLPAPDEPNLNDYRADFYT